MLRLAGDTIAPMLRLAGNAMAPMLRLAGDASLAPFVVPGP
jgi:hypothetical protein